MEPDQIKALTGNMFDAVTAVRQFLVSRRKEVHGGTWDTDRPVDLVVDELMASLLPHTKWRPWGLRIPYFSEHRRGRRKGLHWLGDPLDGSMLEERGSYGSAVVLTLRDGKESLAQFVVDVERGDVYYAIKGQGAYKNGERIHVEERPLRENIIVFDGKQYLLHNPHLFGELQNQIPQIVIKPAGALEFALLAAGEIDGRLLVMPWGEEHDYPFLIAEEAGAVVIDLGPSVGSSNKRNVFVGSQRLYDELFDDPKFEAVVRTALVPESNSEAAIAAMNPVQIEEALAMTAIMAQIAAREDLETWEYLRYPMEGGRTPLATTPPIGVLVEDFRDFCMNLEARADDADRFRRYFRQLTERYDRLQVRQATRWDVVRATQRGMQKMLAASSADRSFNNANAFWSLLNEPVIDRNGRALDALFALASAGPLDKPMYGVRAVNREEEDMISTSFNSLVYGQELAKTAIVHTLIDTVIVDILLTGQTEAVINRIQSAQHLRRAPFEYVNEDALSVEPIESWFPKEFVHSLDAINARFMALMKRGFGREVSPSEISINDEYSYLAACDAVRSAGIALDRRLQSHIFDINALQIPGGFDAEDVHQIVGLGVSHLSLNVPAGEVHKMRAQGGQDWAQPFFEMLDHVGVLDCIHGGYLDGAGVIAPFVVSDVLDEPALRRDGGIALGIKQWLN